MNRMLLAFVLLAVLAGAASAHARLLRSIPAAGAKVSSPLHVTLRFSEALEPAFSGALLLDEDGRNVSGEPVKVNGPLITLTPDHLAPGVYRVSWHSVGHDTQRLDGDFSFTVKP
jgi:methionine-rich copper-binding protein CopC